MDEQASIEAAYASYMQEPCFSDGGIFKDETDLHVEWCIANNRVMYGPTLERYLSRPEVQAKIRKGTRGWHTCEKCGRSTRPVLDGEAWCDLCSRYQ